MAKNRNDGGVPQDPNALPLLVMNTAKELSEGWVFNLSKTVPVVDDISRVIRAAGLPVATTIMGGTIFLETIINTFGSGYPVLREGMQIVLDDVADRARLISVNTPYRDAVRMMDEMKKETTIKLREVQKRWEKPSFAMIEDALGPDDRKKSYEMVQKFLADAALKERWAKCQDLVGSKARVVFMLTLDTPEKQLAYLEGLREPPKKKEAGPVEVVAEKILGLIDSGQSAVGAKLATKVGEFKDKMTAFAAEHHYAALEIAAENRPRPITFRGKKYRPDVGFWILFGLLVITMVVVTIAWFSSRT